MNSSTHRYSKKFQNLAVSATVEVVVAATAVVIVIGFWLDRWAVVAWLLVVLVAVRWWRRRMLRRSYVRLSVVGIEPVLYNQAAPVVRWDAVASFEALRRVPPESLSWQVSGLVGPEVWVVVAKLSDGREVPLWPLSYGDQKTSAGKARGNAIAECRELTLRRDRALLESAPWPSSFR